MDALLTEVQLIKIPRPKFCCSKGQLRSTSSTDSPPNVTSNGVTPPSTTPSDQRPTFKGHGETINNSRQGAPRTTTNGTNGTTTAALQGMNHHINGNFYPAEPPKDYFDDDLHIEALAIRSDEELNRANLSRQAVTQTSRGPVPAATTPGSIAPSVVDISRTTGHLTNGNSGTRDSAGDLSNGKNTTNGN